ncbi:MAG: hypothetical protein B6U72_02460 [Candidatus Altiarchaeales archaeon ex4484_2]|nr:MAG: hypothetical protein B6U72_02460 [Candidatus Altiarchaeales archaeon ex4484_2]
MGVCPSRHIVRCNREIMSTITKRKAGSFSIFLGFAMVFYIIRQAGFGNIHQILTHLTPGYILMALVIDQLIIGLGAVRWMNFINSANVKVKFRDIYLIHLIGLAVNNVTPVARLGGEPVKLYLLNKYTKIRKSIGSATIIASGFFDLGSFLLLNIIAILLLYFNLQLPLDFAYPLLFFVVVFSTLFLSLVHISIKENESLFITHWLISRLKKIKLLHEGLEKWRERIDEGVKRYVTTVRMSLGSTLLLNLFITVTVRVLEVLRVYMIVLAVNEYIDIMWIIVALAFLIAAGLIPSPPGGFGVVEPTMTAVFLLGGLALSSAITIVLIDRLLTIGVTSLMGFGCVHFLGVQSEITKYQVGQ